MAMIQLEMVTRTRLEKTENLSKILKIRSVALKSHLNRPSKARAETLVKVATSPTNI